MFKWGMIKRNWNMSIAVCYVRAFRIYRSFFHPFRRNKQMWLLLKLHNAIASCGGFSYDRSGVTTNSVVARPRCIDVPDSTFTGLVVFSSSQWAAPQLRCSPPMPTLLLINRLSSRVKHASPSIAWLSHVVVLGVFLSFTVNNAYFILFSVWQVGGWKGTTDTHELIERTHESYVKSKMKVEAKASPAQVITSKQ